MLKASCDAITPEEQQHAALHNNRKFLYQVLGNKLAAIDGNNLPVAADRSQFSDDNDIGKDPLNIDD